jgi:glycosyltransferase involved in cell wall biosynthesis
MKISFVIPAFNEAENIGPCLSSLFRELEGDPFPAEIIVVNNASTDGTGEIASRFPGVVVVDEPRKGLVMARQAGFLRATGDLVANVDADSRLTPGWIQSVRKEFAKDPELVCLSGPYIYYDLPRWKRAVTKFFYILAFGAYLGTKFVLRVSSMAQGGNFVVRRAALEQIGGFDVSIDFFGEDTDIARRLSKVGSVKFTFSLPMYSSGRRFAGEGMLRTGFLYMLNYLWVSFSGRPRTTTSTDVRIGC